ncbi:hypothetical protein CDAR_594791 [Caerostris darwini]|uniref:Uncharacterized protein n=1 Tax=Caerostris darwini TaxID=1538125 RepID=A0AAV4PA58_9ARAC|nr:hypothetical protein CDAR_594791 [Caerostris darwini]
MCECTTIGKGMSELHITKTGGGLREEEGEKKERAPTPEKIPELPGIRHFAKSVSGLLGVGCSDRFCAATDLVSLSLGGGASKQQTALSTPLSQNVPGYLRNWQLRSATGSRRDATGGGASPAGTLLSIPRSREGILNNLLAPPPPRRSFLLSWICRCLCLLGMRQRRTFEYQFTMVESVLDVCLEQSLGQNSKVAAANSPKVKFLDTLRFLLKDRTEIGFSVEALTGLEDTLAMYKNGLY